MRKYFILITALFLFLNSAKSQSTFFVGKMSYPATSSFTLKSNSNSGFGHDLDVTIIKRGESGMIAVSTSGVDALRIKGKLLIYLDNNDIISCIDRGKFDHVNDVSTTLYYLTKEEINKMTESNINTIRFTLGCYNCKWSTEEGAFSASNIGSQEYTPHFSSNLYDNVSPQLAHEPENIKTDVPLLIENLFYPNNKEENELSNYSNNDKQKVDNYSVEKELDEQQEIRQKEMKKTGSILRLSADETSEALYWIPKESRITLIEKTKTFAKVSYKGKIGYITLLDYNNFFANK